VQEPWNHRDDELFVRVRGADEVHRNARVDVDHIYLFRPDSISASI
jgi:hypothetical protein